MFYSKKGAVGSILASLNIVKKIYGWYKARKEKKEEERAEKGGVAGGAIRAPTTINVQRATFVTQGAPRAAETRGQEEAEVDWEKEEAPKAGGAAGAGKPGAAELGQLAIPGWGELKMAQMAMQGAQRERSMPKSQFSAEQKKKTSSAVVKAIGLIVMLVVSAFYLLATPLGSQVLAGGTGVGAEFKSVTKAGTGTFNILKMVTLGQSPVQTFESDTVLDQYQEAAGVTLVSVQPTRTTFLPGQELSIEGRIDAVGFSNADVRAEISAKTDLGLLGNIIDAATSLLGGAGVRDWDCNGDGAENGYTLAIKARDLKNRPFRCTIGTHTEGVPVGFTAAIPVDVTARAKDTGLAASKQIVVADPDVLQTIEGDPLAKFGISKESIESKQKGDTSANLGLGIFGDVDVIEADKQGDDFDAFYFLGLSVSNPVFHSGTLKINLSSLALYVPAPPLDATLLTDSGKQEDFDCKTMTAAEAAQVNLGPTYAKCTLKKKAIDDRKLAGKTYAPAEGENFLLKIKVNKDTLAGQEFATFIAKAVVMYDYINTQGIVVTVQSPV